MEAALESRADVWLCLDFEATCDEGDPPRVRRDEAELIEFSYAIYDEVLDRVTHTGQHYCRNERTPLTDFCTALTGITRDKLEGAGSLGDALVALQVTLNEEALVSRNCCAVVHGAWDLEFLLPANCKAKGLKVPSILRRYVDLRLSAQRHLTWAPATTLAEICRGLGVVMDGREHCGLDDARMVALATGVLRRAGAELTHADLEYEQAAFLASAETRLCLDGLPFAIVAPQICEWFQELGCQTRVEGLRMILGSDGRPSGRALVDFGIHITAASALSSVEGGKLLADRLVLLRPLRESERLEDPKKIIPFPSDAVAVAKLRSVVAPSPQRPGDWICPHCQDHVFARNVSCRKCGAARPEHDAVPSGVAAAAVMKPGDWTCPSCHDLVFARNKACRRCGAARPSTGAPRHTIYAVPCGVMAAARIETGAWSCPTCQDVVFAFRTSCRRCGTQRQ